MATVYNLAVDQGADFSTTIQANDVRLLFQSGLSAPVIDDNCLFDGVNYRVMEVMPISPSGTEIYYDIRLRH